MGKKDFYSFLHLTIAAGENPSLCKQSFCYFLLVKILEEEKISKKSDVRRPGIEPGSQEWESCMIPLHQRRLLRNNSGCALCQITLLVAAFHSKILLPWVSCSTDWASRASRKLLKFSLLLTWRRWCSGIMQDSHSCDPGSIPGRRNLIFSI